LRKNKEEKPLSGVEILKDELNTLEGEAVRLSLIDHACKDHDKACKSIERRIRSLKRRLNRAGNANGGNKPKVTLDD
jgi:hypothetical protein